VTKLLQAGSSSKDRRSKPRKRLVAGRRTQPEDIQDALSGMIICGMWQIPSGVLGLSDLKRSTSSLIYCKWMKIAKRNTPSV
jgi:hypothetical protein